MYLCDRIRFDLAFMLASLNLGQIQLLSLLASEIQFLQALVEVIGTLEPGTWQDSRAVSLYSQIVDFNA